MVTLAQTTSTSQFRRRFLRSGLRNFRASSNLRRAALPPHARCTMRDAKCWRSPAGGKKQYYLDQEIALYLLGSGNNGRYYDATTGRFLSEDPTKEQGGDENLYRYTGNDPVNNLDPSGHNTQPPPPPPQQPYHPPQHDSAANTKAHPTPTSPSNTKGANGHAENGEHQKQQNSPASHHVASAKPGSPAVTHPKIASEQQQQEIPNYGHKGQQDQAKIASLRANWQRDMQVRLGQIHSNPSDAQLYSRMQHDIAQINVLEHNLGQLQNEFNKAGLNQVIMPEQARPTGDVLAFIPGGSGFENAVRMAGEIGALPTDSGGLQPTYDVVTIGAGGEIGKLGDAVVGKLVDAVIPIVKGIGGKVSDAIAPAVKGVIKKVSSLANKAIDALGKISGKTEEESGATFGKAASSDYRKTFFSVHPELKGKVIAHHAVEQQTLTRFPGTVTESEIHSLENLRGIPKDMNTEVHLRSIRREWNRFYRQNPKPTKAQFLQKATEIDKMYGTRFNPPVGGHL